MPGRRQLIVLVALLAVPLPACLHVSTPAPTKPENTKPVAKIEPAPPRLEFGDKFAELPSLPRTPGTVVRTNPNTNTSISQNTTPRNDTPKPTNPPTGAVPSQPPGTVLPAGGAPGPLPLAPALEPPLLAAVREFAAGRSDRALDALRGLDKQNQDFVLAMLPVLASGASANLNNDSATVAAMMDQLNAIVARLEPKAALRIEKVAFCSDVSGFGRYTPRPAETPYRPNAQVQLYLEVRNLGSQPTGDGFLTNVHATVEVRDAHQKLVDQIDPEDYRRRVPVVRYEKRLASRSPLHDFHVLYIFSAPPAPGVYTITVELRDASGRRVVKTAPTQFCVAGQ